MTQVGAVTRPAPAADRVQPERPEPDDPRPGERLAAADGPAVANSEAGPTRFVNHPDAGRPLLGKIAPSAAPGAA